MSASSDTFNSFGLLEHILSFVSVNDLLAATEVNRRFKMAGRSNILWETACRRSWNIDGDVQDETTLFWRSSWNDEVASSLTVRQIRSLFSHFLLHNQKEKLKKCLEKSEMVNLVCTFRDSIVKAPVRFSDLWFGAYASSVIDSKRTIISREELCSPYGFNVYFKILEEEVWDETDMVELLPYEGHEGVMLFHHSVSYFKPNGEFEMEMKDPDSHYPIDLHWRSSGKAVQVGPYPQLIVTRQKGNRGWKLENVHVVMLFRHTKANFARGSDDDVKLPSSSHRSL